MTNRTERQQQITARLEAAHIRPTRQRIMLAHLLFSDQRHRHITAEELFAEARKAGERVSLATVYNTLNHFAASGLLQEFSVEAGSSYFDTNTDHHHHFLVARTGELLDIPAQDVSIDKLPEPPEGYEIEDIEVTIRLRARG